MNPGLGPLVLLPSGKVLRFSNTAAGTATEFYDPTAGPSGRWSAGPSLAGSFKSSEAIFPILLAGGPKRCAAQCGKVLVPLLKGQVRDEPDWQIFDPASKEAAFTSAGVPAFLRALGATATLIEGKNCGDNCGKVLVAGGFADYGAKGGIENAGSTQSAELYDPKTNSWALTGKLTTGRMYHAAVLLSGPNCGPNCGKVLLVGGGFRCLNFGSCRGADSTAEFYDPAAGTFAPAGTPASPHQRGHSATLLADGRVLVASIGKSHVRPRDQKPEVYDPRTNSWQAAGTCICPNFYSATRLQDGKVLVAGGETSASAELYDPRSNSWHNDAPLSGPRGGHSALLLTGARCGRICGSVLVAGGEGSSSTELYRPPPEKMPASSGKSGLGRNSILTKALAGIAGLAAIVAVVLTIRRRRRP